MYKLFRLFQNTILFLMRKRTVGVQLLLVRNNQVLLVKHSYCPGWFTIGGAVDPGESPLQAVLREAKEEVGVTLNTPPQLFGVYYNQCHQHDDYVSFYVASDFKQEEVYCPEIAEQRWFDLTALPADVSLGTQRRVDEYLGKTPISDLW